MQTLSIRVLAAILGLTATAAIAQDSARLKPPVYQGLDHSQEVRPRWIEMRTVPQPVMGDHHDTVIVTPIETTEHHEGVVTPDHQEGVLTTEHREGVVTPD